MSTAGTIASSSAGSKKMGIKKAARKKELRIVWRSASED